MRMSKLFLKNKPLIEIKKALKSEQIIYDKVDVKIKKLKKELGVLRNELRRSKERISTIKNKIH